MKKHLANLITSIRLVGAISLIFIETLSKTYFIVYIISGLSDALDGLVARSLKITSKLGSKLDSISDLIFFGVTLIKEFPFILAGTPFYVEICIIIAIAIRMLLYLYVGLHYEKFPSRHTILNKTVSLMMFFLPFAIISDYLTIYAMAIVIIGMISNVEELIYIIHGSYA